MFSCADASQILQGVNESRRSYCQRYVRLAAFDVVEPVRVMSFLVQQPCQNALALSSLACWAMASTTGKRDMKA